MDRSDASAAEGSVVVFILFVLTLPRTSKARKSRRGHSFTKTYTRTPALPENLSKTASWNDDRPKQ
jgi:hypothetical protein